MRRASCSGCAANRQKLIEKLEQRTLLAGDFTIVGLSDTQYAVESNPQIFNTQTQWVVDHAADYNIAFLAHQGDMLRRGYSNYQSGNADSALFILNGKVPYTVDIGNHDFDNQFDDLDHHISSANFTSWFGDARYQSIPGSGFGGSSLDQRNRYQIFTAGGRQFMVISIEWEAEDSAIAWAQGVINSHRQIPVILTTHEYLNGSGRTTSPLDPAGNAGESIFQKLIRPNPQIFLVLSGHTGAIYHQASTNSSSNPDYSQVWETVGDFEGRSGGLGGWLQLFHFYPDQNQISVTSYSPLSNQWDTSSAAQYSMNVNFAKRFGFGNGAVANDDTFDSPSGQTLNANVLANDYDSAALALNATQLTQPSHGSASVTPNGILTYTPASGFHGNDSFTYRVSDGTTNSVAQVTVRVNSAPVAMDDAATITESRLIAVNVVGNDTDPDGNPLRPILTRLPAHGAVFANSDGTFTYTPDPKFVGTDTFSYVASDGMAVSAPADVNVTVTPAPPVYDYPIGETTTYGLRTGSYVNLTASDGVEETITEVAPSGSAILDHRWQFNVTGGTEVSLCIRAKRSLGVDEYHLQYSTNGANWYDLTRYVPASSLNITRILYDADEPYQMWLLPSSTKGALWIRAQDAKSNTDICSLTIDEMFVRSVQPPQNVSITGTAGPDTISVRQDGYYVKYSVNGAEEVSIPRTQIANFTISGGGEDDLIGIDYSGGNPFPNGATITGGDGTDSLVFKGMSGDVNLGAIPGITYSGFEKAGFGDGSVRFSSIPAGVGLVAMGTANVAVNTSMTMPSLDIADSATVSLAAGGTGALVIGPSATSASLNISGAGTLDLNNNGLILQAGSATDREALFAAASALLRQARGSDGKWSGTGIKSSIAAAEALANPTGSTTGIAIRPNIKLDQDGNVVGALKDTFKGQSGLDTNAVLAAYSFNGDENLDAMITFDDYFQINSGFLSNGVKKGYWNGDFNYDGLINFDDYYLINTAFLGQSSHAPLPPMARAAAAPRKDASLATSRSRPKKHGIAPAKAMAKITRRVRSAASPTARPRQSAETRRC